MSQSPQVPFALVPERDVIERDGQTIATSDTPWLRLNSPELRAAGWIKIGYSTSFFDDPVRPLIRFIGADTSETIATIPAPVLGRAFWIGAVPPGTVTICISPTCRPGPFSFRIEFIRRLSGAQILKRAAANDFYQTLRAIYHRLRGWRKEAHHLLIEAATTTPLRDYWDWAERHSRSLDLAGSDRPRTNWAEGPTFRLFMRIDGMDAKALARTAQSLQDQVYPNWSLIAVSDQDPAFGPEIGELWKADKRYGLARATDALSLYRSGNAYLGGLTCGDTLPAHALAVVAESAARFTDWSAVYCDEDWPDSLIPTPLFKPDFSPELQAATDYCGPFTLIRAALCPSSEIAEFLKPAQRTQLLISTGPKSVGHIRRVLNHRSPSTLLSRQSQSEAPDTIGTWPKVSIVIPTRDRLDLLKPCIKGLLTGTDYAQMHIVVVDNGSSAPDTLSFLASLKAQPTVTVLTRPGPFNYSALCNDGAAIGQPEILVFLNNDVSVIEPGWLKALVRWAARPDVGAVGPKLLFPNGKIQHAGVVIGLRGCAEHPYYRAPGNEDGYLGILAIAREVSAVTGACLAVEKRKFDAIGGFDAVNLPVSRNDTDLCLRLTENGWKCLVAPKIVLHHVESASRGYYVADEDPHIAEDAFFIRKWGHFVRDDPYFHPAFSLASHDVKLDN